MNYAPKIDFQFEGEWEINPLLKFGYQMTPVDSYKLCHISEVIS